MDEWQKFRDAYGEGRPYRPFGPQDRAALADRVPEFLLALWEMDGWAGYRDGLLWTVDPREFEPLVDLWKPPTTPAFPIARTAFGTLLMLHPYVPEEDEYADEEDDEDDETDEQAVVVVDLDPHLGTCSMVAVDNRRYLTASIAKDRYMENVFLEPRVQRAIKDVGPLAWDEMYAFEPALELGGSGAPETVRRVKLFDHHLLLSQLVELKFVKY